MWLLERCFVVSRNKSTAEELISIKVGRIHLRLALEGLAYMVDCKFGQKVEELKLNRNLNIRRNSKNDETFVESIKVASSDEFSTDPKKETQRLRLKTKKFDFS